MFRWPLPDRLNLLLAGLLVFTAWGPLCCNIFRVGCDTMQFYTAGDLVNRGQAARLYDHPYFLECQRRIGGPDVDPADYSSHLYPPSVALLAAPWARLPYPDARAVWWAVQSLLLVVAGWMAWRGTAIPPRWRVTAMLALAALFPIWIALRIGQLSPVWLASLLGGILLHRRGNRLTAGLVLSILAIKPQLAAPVFIWLLLRRDWRSIGGMAMGVAVQGLAVMVFLGPGMPFYYFHEFPHLAKAAKVAIFSAAYEQSFAGTLQGLLFRLGWLPLEHGWAAMLMQPLIGVVAGIWLFQAVRAHARSRLGGESPEAAAWYEYACASLFVLLLTPHLLLYDASLLAVPIVCLWSSPGWRMGVLLWLSATVVAPYVSFGLGFSPTPFVMFWVLYRVSRQLVPEGGFLRCPAGDCAMV